MHTNTAPTGPYRGSGRPVGVYLIERVMDEAARATRLDPVEIRRRNFIPPEAFPCRTAFGVTYDSGAYAAATRSTRGSSTARSSARSLRASARRSRRPLRRSVGFGAAFGKRDTDFMQLRDDRPEQLRIRLPGQLSGQTDVVPDERGDSFCVSLLHGQERAAQEP